LTFSLVRPIMTTIDAEVIRSGGVM